MDKKDFLLEIGVEELPAEHIKPAMDYLEKSFIAFAEECRLHYQGILRACTARRLTIIIKGLDSAQKDNEILRLGPAKKICFDAEGGITAAGAGFLRKNNAQIEDLHFEQSDKGEVLALKIFQKGEQTAELLRGRLISIISNVPFGKRMVWQSKDLSFSRPIRSLVVLWGDAVLDISLVGLVSGRNSFGIRHLGLRKPIAIPDADSYFEVLRGAGVIAKREERLEEIRKQLRDISTNSSYRVIEDEKLLDTIVDMVEYPTAVVAEFDEYFLNLPAKIITSTISQNQKYFGMEDKASGDLINKFVFISNGKAEYSELIRIGNEKVVKPRLADAMWYYQTDTKRKLESYIPALDEVVFHSKLGSVGDKCRRLIELCAFICEEAGLEAQIQSDAKRAAALSKADLVTLMIGEKEFTKLQGYIGKHYALASGEAEAVAEAIYEHYLPKGQADELPQGVVGAVLAVADRLDTLCGILGIGLIPTGSGDPYALRRAGNGIVQILAQRNWSVRLPKLVEYALSLYHVELKPDTRDVAQSFLEQRIEWLLKQEGYDYDIINSVMHIDKSDVPDLLCRAKALAQIRQEEDFIRLVVGFKRVSNILGSTQISDRVETSLLKENAEQTLYSALLELKTDIDHELKQGSYMSLITKLVAMGSVIDAFFDGVLVNCDDQALRNNRLALLCGVKNEFLKLADLSLLVVETN